jgi:hypothetical protein
MLVLLLRNICNLFFLCKYEFPEKKEDERDRERYDSEVEAQDFDLFNHRSSYCNCADYFWRIPF